MNNLFTLCLTFTVWYPARFRFGFIKTNSPSVQQKMELLYLAACFDAYAASFRSRNQREPILQSIGQNPLTEAAAGLSPLKYGNGFSISDPSGPMSAVSLSSMLESHIFSVVWLALALLLLLRKLYLYGQAASAIRSQSKEAAEGPLPTVLQR